jgi:hypothetical protein
VDPANSESYVVQKLPDGKYFAYLGLSDVSVLANVGVGEGATLGKVASNFEGILSDSPDAWLGQGNLQDPVAYLGLTAPDAVLPEPTPVAVEEPVAVVDDPAPVPVDEPTPLADPAPVLAAPDAPTGEVVDAAPVLPAAAVVVPSAPASWALSTTSTANPTPQVTVNVTGGPTAPPTSFDYIVSSTSPSKGTPVTNTVEEIPVKNGIIGAVTSLPFWNDLGTRAINTFLQVGGGALGTGALGITHLSYKNALELGAAAAVLSIVTSLTRATSIKS